MTDNNTEEKKNLRRISVICEAGDTRFDSLLYDSMRIYDQSLYYLRQEYFKSRDSGWTYKPMYPSWFGLCGLVKETDSWNSKMDINLKKRSIKLAVDAWKAWIKSKDEYDKNPEKFQGKPVMPRYIYRRKNYQTFVVDKTRFRGSSETDITIPCTKIKIRIPDVIKKEWIVELRVLKENKRPVIEFIYDYDMRNAYMRSQNNTEDIMTQMSDSSESELRILSLDLGKVNLITGMTFNCGKDDTSFIIRGEIVNKRIDNQIYKISKLESAALKSKNKEITKISKKNGNRVLCGQSNEMARLWTEYNCFMDNVVGNLSSMIIDFCLEKRINVIVIGLNKEWKQEIELGRQNNKLFCHFPHKRLVEYIERKAGEQCINAIVTEESYTSKCDHLAGEEMCHHDTYLGKRKYRGLFKSSTGRLIHSDVNGCIGMIRKTNLVEDAVLIDSLLRRGDIVSPVVLNMRGFAPRNEEQ